MQNLLLPLENYSFYGFFFLQQEISFPIYCAILHSLPIQRYLKKYLNAFQKWILTGTKLREPRVQLLKIHYENLNLGPWRSAAKESTYLSLLLHMRLTTLK